MRLLRVNVFKNLDLTDRMGSQMTSREIYMVGTTRTIITFMAIGTF